MSARVETYGLKIDEVLFRFVEEKVLPGVGVSSSAFWNGMAELAQEFGPENRRLLAVRAELPIWLVELLNEQEAEGARG